MSGNKWGVGSNQYKKRPGTPSSGGEPRTKRVEAAFRDQSPVLATTGRVSWNRSAINFDLIPESKQDRAIFRYKKALPELIWNAAALEGNTYTLPQVKTLLDGVTIGGKKLEEAEQILALSEGMNAMIAHVENNTFSLTKSISDEIHGLVARHEAIEAGMFRGEGFVSGGGTVELTTGEIIAGDSTGERGSDLITDYQNLEVSVNNLSDPRERALAYFASATRSQFYFDGNKRTARIMMAGELMAHGYEAVSVPYARAAEFNTSLNELFKSNDATELMDFLTTCAPVNH